MDQVQMKTLFDGIQQVKADLMDYFDTNWHPICVTLSEMKVSLTNLGEHVSEMEQRVGANEDNLSNLLTRVKKLENDKLHLMSKDP